ncbi:hypothetical protein HN51_050893 [Arachis hypogaea]
MMEFQGSMILVHTTNLGLEGPSCRSQASTSTMSNFGILLSAMPYPTVSSQQLNIKVPKDLIAILPSCLGIVRDKSSHRVAAGCLDHSLMIC